MVFNTTFNNISVISWWSVLLVQDTGVPGENHRPAVSHSLFVHPLLAIVLSVLLRYTDSDYPFGIFKLFSNCITIDGVQDCNTEIVSPVLFYHCISYVDHMLLQILI